MLADWYHRHTVRQIRYAVLMLLVAVSAGWMTGLAGASQARAAACQLAEPFVAFAAALGMWTVGECEAEPTIDPDGSVHQQTGQGVLSRFAGSERPVFREATRLWIDGPGGMAGEVRIVIPASDLGGPVEARRRTVTVLERAALDEPAMPMGWETLPPPTGKTLPEAACQSPDDGLALGRVQAVFGEERGQVRVLHSISALRDGGGPEQFARLRSWLAECQEWRTTIGSQQLTFRAAVRPLAPLGEESIRYVIESEQQDAMNRSYVDTVVVWYGDLFISNAFLMSAPDQVKDGDLIGISELSEAKLRAALR